MRIELDQCENQAIDPDEKNGHFQNDTLIYTSTTVSSSIARLKSTRKKDLNFSDEKRFDYNSLITVILFVIMNTINYMDRFALAGKFINCFTYEKKWN